MFNQIFIINRLGHDHYIRLTCPQGLTEKFFALENILYEGINKVDWNFKLSLVIAIHNPPKAECCHAIKYEIRDTHNAQSGSATGYAETSEIRAMRHESLLLFQACGLAELIDHVGFFPGEIGVISSEMSAVRSVGENRTSKF